MRRLGPVLVLCALALVPGTAGASPGSGPAAVVLERLSAHASMLVVGHRGRGAIASRLIGSEKDTPGTAVAIGENSPRSSFGAPGLGSNVS